jgi:hypothetical protein
MTSAANRRNAQKSTGPRTAAGKARTYQNALRHGLSLAPSYDQATAAEIGDLAGELCSDGDVPEQRELAFRAAAAQIDMCQLKLKRVDLINTAAARLPQTDLAGAATDRERVIEAFNRNSKTLAAFDRYERRLFAKRNRSLRRLDRLQAAEERSLAAERREWFAEEVGPRLPKERGRRSPFVEPVAELRLSDLMKTVSKGFKGWCWLLQHPSISAASAFVSIKSNAGKLKLRFNARGESVVQNFTIARRLTRVGGGNWLIECPETKKMVRSIYLASDQQRFRSKHALGLTYTVNTGVAWRHEARLEKLMDRIGASDPLALPARPKYMRRRTYSQLCQAIRDAYLDMLAACGSPWAKKMRVIRARLAERSQNRQRLQC